MLRSTVLEDTITIKILYISTNPFPKTFLGRILNVKTRNLRKQKQVLCENNVNEIKSNVRIIKIFKNIMISFKMIYVHIMNLHETVKVVCEENLITR